MVGAGLGNSISSKWKVWEQELQHDIDKNFLLQGLREGFRISNITDSSEVSEAWAPNHGSAFKYREKVEKELLYQLGRGYYVKTDVKPKVISPLGAILKDNGVDVRIIHDGSQPEVGSMNSYALHDSVKYQSLAEALELAKPGTFLAKVDLKSAYRSVEINPVDHCLTGIQWTFQGDSEPTFMIDT